MSKQSNSPSPSGEVRWGLMSLAEEVFDKAEYLSLPYYYICKKNKRDKISLIT